MQKLYSLLLAIICTLAHPSLLNAMKRALQATSPTKRDRDNTGIIDLTNVFLESPEKKNPSGKSTISRTINHLTWQEAMILGSKLPTLTPQEYAETITVEVDPLVEAVYYDNAAKLKHILEIESPNLLCYTRNIIHSMEAASLLDIAAERQSYQCLEYLESILHASKPTLSLEALACHAVTAQLSPELTETAQRHCPELDFDACNAQATHIHLYYRIAPRLRQLYKVAHQSSIKIARQSSDIRCASLIQNGFNTIKN